MTLRDRRIHRAEAMRQPHAPTHSSPVGRARTTGRQVEESFSTSDQVLLCCFGRDLTGERTYEQLRRALLAAGFTGSLARHLVRVSPLLHRAAAGCYRLQKLGE